MAKTLKTEIIINTTPDKVWAILTDFSNYPVWNPFIKSIEGAVKVGNTINVSIEPPGAKGMKFKPTVLCLDTNKEFRWIGRTLFAGVFDGEHKFELIDNKNGTTTFIHSERFTGLLVPLLKKMLDVNTRNGFEAMNKQLKEEAEKGNSN